MVRLNGELLAAFRVSDAKFARLLRLRAAARAAAPTSRKAGWLKKAPHLQLDEREVDLVELRNALVADQPDGYANMTAAERKALLQSSTDRPGMLRLPLNPAPPPFDPSLANLRLLGDKQSEPREEKPAKGKRKTSAATSSRTTRRRHAPRRSRCSARPARSACRCPTSALKS